jgi:hypothetical protein
MTTLDLRHIIFFPPGAFVSVRPGLMLRMSLCMVLEQQVDN